ncbi:MAG: 2-dehydro-3-deoxygalactonokinase [Burkholderiales bacterium]
MIAIDWGTSSLRAYLLDQAGRVQSARSAAQGILAVEGNRFSDALESLTGDWIASGAAPIVMSGMIGSRQGWLEVPYVQCPAGFTEIRAGLRPVRWKEHVAWIVPGVNCRDDSAVPDVMRGEETQVLGAMEQLGQGRHLLCLPGTHSKWVNVDDGRIVRFATYMTGETFAVFKSHSILGRMMKEDVPDAAAFDAGVHRSADPGGVLHHLFGVRTRGLFEEISGNAAASYLSGILIGHEIRAARASAGIVHLLGSAQLAETYTRALATLGIASSTLPSDAAAAALFKLAQQVRP